MVCVDVIMFEPHWQSGVVGIFECVGYDIIASSLERAFFMDLINEVYILLGMAKKTTL